MPWKQMMLAKLMPALLALMAAYGLASCSSSVGTSVPPWAGGIPPTAPTRASVQAPYPNVDDVPPPRAVKLISQPEQARIEAELTAIRRRTNAQGEGSRKEQNTEDR